MADGRTAERRSGGAAGHFGHEKSGCDLRSRFVLKANLFNGDFGADFFEFGFDVFSFFFGNFFFEGLGSSVNKSFGFFEAETGDTADFFDDFDFFIAGGFEDYIEFSLIAGSSAFGGSGGNGGNGYGSSGGYAKFFFKSFY